MTRKQPQIFYKVSFGYSSVASAQQIFSFESCQPLSLYYEKPAPQGTRCP